MNVFRSALRSARRRPGFAALNVVGLAVGLACWMLIALYVHDESTADRFHERADRIVRVSQQVTTPGREALWAWSGGAMGEVIERDLAAVETTVRVIQQARPVRAEASDERFREPHFTFADETFFSVFSYDFLRGDAATALAQPDGVVLTESAARRYFGDADPMGQTFVYASNGARTAVVSGVIADPPANAHLPLSVIVPMAAFKSSHGFAADASFDSFWWPTTWTYALLQPGTDREALQAGMGDFIARHRQDGTTYLPTLEPLTDLRFSPATATPTPTVSRSLVQAFAVIAFAVLLLACVNVVNLSTAQATTRVKEVGVRKALGAGRAGLGALFVGEAVVLCGVAFALALALVAAALPAFNGLMGKALDLHLLRQPATWAVLTALVVGTGIAAGAYPALVMSGFRPSRALRGLFVAGRGAALRKTLVVVQFAVTIALAASAAVAFQQLRYLKDAPLGFDQEEVVTLRLPGERWETLRAALEDRAEVVDVTGSASRPGFGTAASLPYEAEGVATDDAEGPRMGMEFVDYGYVEMLGIDVVAGRSFSPAFPADEGRRMDESSYFHIEGSGLLLNQAAVRRLGWADDEAIGKALRFFAYENGTYYTDLRGRVVGVVSDYHASSFEEELRPLAFSLAQSPFGNSSAWALVKVRPGDAAATMAALRSVWDEVHPESPFEASFLSADLDARYASQDRLAVTVAGFAWMGGLIACLGLFGLAAFAAERRRKEVGVRKVLGASVASLVALLSREFVALVAVACVVAVPLAWAASSRWLDGFAYRIDLGPVPFLAVVALALAVTLATVSAHAVRTATDDPVRALRSE
jgi:putative ABC transport system permease protein